MMQSGMHTHSLLNGKEKIVREYPKRILPLCYCDIFVARCYHIL